MVFKKKYVREKNCDWFLKRLILLCYKKSKRIYVMCDVVVKIYW